MEAINLYGRESWGSDIAAAATAMAAGYLLTSMGKASANPLIPLITTAAAGLAGVGGKHFVRNEYGHAMLSAVGTAGFTNVGNWVAEATTTIGGKGPGAAPVYLPTAANSAGLARAAAARARAELALRAGGASQADIVQPLAPATDVPTTVFQYKRRVA